ncbi:Response regulator receiver domain-containing protein [Desulfonauticus submarinus]|uniref:Response regulator receiver domain-containing protein n=1 Tax=Desulfonauticus submarinus TaxID=206665 RepID=A0A1H0FLN0_9BACT|nr:response regulator [Desulfonauticus submarinus]SDN95520.1 Response regulator receiver domain-containing protein [Desulfonauticus submarinus]
MENTKVLIVDDEQEFCNSLAERMKTRGLEVATASSGAEAIQKLKKDNFDTIILDLVMPGMDGIETLKKIKQEMPEVQIILLTGQASVQKSVEAMKLGAFDFVEKPAEIKELLKKIQEAKNQKMILIQKKHEEKIKHILEEKGW